MVGTNYPVSTSQCQLFCADDSARTVPACELSSPKRCADLAEPLRGEPTAVRQLVAPIPAPRRDHRQHEDPALAQQVLVDIRIVIADLVGRVGEVELDGSPAARLEVDEQRPVLRGEDVPRVRFAVQQLFGGAPVDD